MNRLIKLLLASLLLLSAAFTADAQQHHKNNSDFKARLKSEKIAFITDALSMTPEEAQLFWPVYNQIQKDSETSFAAVVKSYRALCKAVEENKSPKEIEAALEAYTKALSVSKTDEQAKKESLMKVIPVEKVARLYVAEEKFRKMQVHRFRDYAGQNHGKGFHSKKQNSKPKPQGD